MQNASIWRALLCVENTVVEDVEFDDQTQVLVAHVRPRRASRGRCGTSGSTASWYDRGQGRRRWRALDMGTTQVFLEADAPAGGLPGPRSDGATSPLGPTRCRTHPLVRPAGRLAYTNGPLRRYFPKGTDLSRHTRVYLVRIELELNHRPRPILDDRTPADLITRLLTSKMVPVLQ